MSNVQWRVYSWMSRLTFEFSFLFCCTQSCHACLVATKPLLPYLNLFILLQRVFWCSPTAKVVRVFRMCCSRSRSAIFRINSDNKCTNNRSYRFENCTGFHKFIQLVLSFRHEQSYVFETTFFVCKFTFARELISMMSDLFLQIRTCTSSFSVPVLVANNVFAKKLPQRLPGYVLV